jgi:hypothetical protein
VPRRGCAVSEVRIIPVEYSAVIASAASNPALLAGLWLKLAAIPAVMAASMPMETTSSASRVQ